MTSKNAMGREPDTRNRTALGITQFIIGVTLLLSSLYVFSMLQSNIVMLPAFMGVALIGHSIHGLVIKRAHIKVIKAA